MRIKAFLAAVQANARNNKSTSYADAASPSSRRGRTPGEETPERSRPIRPVTPPQAPPPHHQQQLCAPIVSQLPQGYCPANGGEETEDEANENNCCENSFSVASTDGEEDPIPRKKKPTKPSTTTATRADFTHKAMPAVGGKRDAPERVSRPTDMLLKELTKRSHTTIIREGNGRAPPTPPTGGQGEYHHNPLTPNH